MLTLHLYHMSPYNEKIQRMLNAKGVAYEEKYWRLGEQKQVKKINPSGKLPALEHDGHWVCDSTLTPWISSRRCTMPTSAKSRRQRVMPWRRFLSTRGCARKGIVPSARTPV